MQKLEEILKELEKFTFEAEVYNGDFEGADIDNLLCLGDVRDVLRNHMNNDWIPVGERLPTMEEYQKNDGRFILDDGNRRYQGLFDVYERKFKVAKYISGIIPVFEGDSKVIAWMPLPGPYRPESNELEEKQEWKERMLRNFMKKGEK